MMPTAKGLLRASSKPASLPAGSSAKMGTAMPAGAVLVRLVDGRTGAHHGGVELRGAYRGASPVLEHVGADQVIRLPGHGRRRQQCADGGPGSGTDRLQRCDSYSMLRTVTECCGCAESGSLLRRSLLRCTSTSRSSPPSQSRTVAVNVGMTVLGRLTQRAEVRAGRRDGSPRTLVGAGLLCATTSWWHHERPMHSTH